MECQVKGNVNGPDKIRPAYSIRPTLSTLKLLATDVNERIDHMIY